MKDLPVGTVGIGGFDEAGAPARSVSPVAETKQLRVDLDGVLQRLKMSNGPGLGLPPKWTSRERSIAITKLQEAIMWLGMDLKAMREAGLAGSENPYPESYNPNSPTIEPTAQGLKL